MILTPLPFCFQLRTGRGACLGAGLGGVWSPVWMGEYK